MERQTSDQQPVTLDDLKRAIEFVPTHPGHFIPGENLDSWLALLHEHRRWALEAWRTAFEWREGWYTRMDGDVQSSAEAAGLMVEGIEGMTLIQEKLR